MGLLNSPMPSGKRIRLVERNTRSNRIFARHETPKMRPAPAGACASDPLPIFAVPVNTSGSASIVCPQAGIAAVLIQRGVPQISEAIISPVTVDMVNDALRPKSKMDGPRNPVRLVNVVEDAPHTITFTGYGGERLCANISGVPARSSTCPMKPKQFSCLRFEVQEFSAHLWCDSSFISHSVLPHVCGQGRARVQPRLRPVFHSKMQQQRQAKGAQYYRSLRTFPIFGKGWLRRNREVTAAALEMGR